MFKLNDVIQFTEGHQWVGCFGFIEEIKETGDDIKYLIGVPIPMKGTAYIYSMASKQEFEKIGRAVMILKIDEHSAGG